MNDDDHLVVCRRGCVRHDARGAVERAGTQDAHCAAGGGREGLPRGGTRVGLEGEPPGLPRYAVRTVRPRLVRVPSTYSTWVPGGRPPCASDT